MSKFFKFFGQSDKKKKTQQNNPGDGDEEVVNPPPSFERRISVSNSGRWKQKKSRNKVYEDMFRSECDNNNREVISDEPSEDKKDNLSQNSVQDDKTEETGTIDKKAKAVMEETAF